MSTIAAYRPIEKADLEDELLLDLEHEWSAFFRSLNEARRFRIHDVEAELHDLFIGGDVDLAEVRRYLNSFGEGAIT